MYTPNSNRLVPKTALSSALEALGMLISPYYLERAIAKGLPVEMKKGLSGKRTVLYFDPAKCLTWLNENKAKLPERAITWVEEVPEWSKKEDKPKEKVELVEITEADLDAAVQAPTPEPVQEPEVSDDGWQLCKSRSAVETDISETRLFKAGDEVEVCLAQGRRNGVDPKLIGKRFIVESDEYEDDNNVRLITGPEGRESWEEVPANNLKLLRPAAGTCYYRVSQEADGIAIELKAGSRVFQLGKLNSVREFGITTADLQVLAEYMTELL
jgi:hypothetical protein